MACPLAGQKKERSTSVPLGDRVLSSGKGDKLIDAVVWQIEQDTLCYTHCMAG